MAKRIFINGSITCPPDDLDMLLVEVDEHIRLTRAEPGCVYFDITPAPNDPGSFVITEEFQDRAAFDSHTARTRASKWWSKTGHIPRDIQVTER